MMHAGKYKDDAVENGEQTNFNKNAWGMTYISDSVSHTNLFYSLRVYLVSEFH